VPSYVKTRNHSQHIGYRNFTAKCLPGNYSKMGCFEQLTETYNRMNAELMDKPLEGYIIYKNKSLTQ
jgi:hypothetical protein